MTFALAQMERTLVFTEVKAFLIRFNCLGKGGLKSFNFLRCKELASMLVQLVTYFS